MLRLKRKADGFRQAVFRALHMLQGRATISEQEAEEVKAGLLGQLK
jgi:hypothetical protein